MNEYTITHPAEALSVLAIDPMGWNNRDRLYISLTDIKAAKKHKTLYVVVRDRATGAIIKATAEEDTAARVKVYGDIDAAGRALLTEVIAGDKFAAQYLNKAS